MQQNKNGDWFGGNWNQAKKNKARFVFRQRKLNDFSKFQMPYIRKVMPSLIAADIVGVQPMTQPSSMVFYINHMYGTKEALK